VLPEHIVSSGWDVIKRIDSFRTPDDIKTLLREIDEDRAQLNLSEGECDGCLYFPHSGYPSA